jgi:hypothetical protein
LTAYKAFGSRIGLGSIKGKNQDADGLTDGSHRVH